MTQPDQGRDGAPLSGVRVAHLGHFDPAYSRNRIMAKALARAGATVMTLTDGRSYVQRTPGLAQAALRTPVDLYLVGFPGHADVASARLGGLRHRAPVLFDAFVSLYETEEDRRCRPGIQSATAYRYLLEDWLACHLATRVIVDTDTHLDHFARHFRIDRTRLHRLWVGADDEIMVPGPPRPEDGSFRVFVYASFIPLHGLTHVVGAAHVLEQRHDDVQVDIVGAGATEAEVRRLVAALGTTNVRLLGARPYAELPARMAASDLCLGIFGTSAKADRVIPNKAYDALAVARPLLTADTAAAREVFTHRDNAYLCRPGDPESLADAIATLKRDPALRAGIAARGHELFRSRFSIDALSRDIVPVVRDAIASSA